jgi:hypothetical protein
MVHRTITDRVLNVITPHAKVTSSSITASYVGQNDMSLYFNHHSLVQLQQDT